MFTRNAAQTTRPRGPRHGHGLLGPINRRALLKGSGVAAAGLLVPGARPAAVLAEQYPEDAESGGTLIAVLPTDPQTLNGAMTTSSPTQIVAGALFDSLVIHDNELTPVPNLAESWEISDDARTYTFHLVEGVTWHDGQPFTSADVKFTAEEVWRVHHSRNRVALANLDRVETPDDSTAVFQFTEPWAALLSSVGKYEGSIIPKHLYEGTDILDNPNNTENPVGTGPFKFQEWVTGDHLTVVRNPDYWRDGQPYLDEIVYQIIPDPSARGLALEAGDIDYIPSAVLPPPSDLARLVDTPGIVVEESPNLLLGGTMNVMFNLRREITGNQLVRQAIAYALDREFMAENVMLGYARPVNGPFSDPWYDDDAVQKYPYDPSMADQLLDEAGYPRDSSGTRFTLGFSYDTGRYSPPRVAEVVREQLADVGIEIELQGTDRATAEQAQFLSHEFDLAIPSAFVGTGPDPCVGIQRFYHSDNIGEALYNNGAGYRNPEVDDLFEQAAGTVDVEQRKELFSAVQAQITREVPYQWLMAQGGVVLYQENVANIGWTDPYEMDLASIYLVGASS